MPSYYFSKVVFLNSPPWKITFSGSPDYDVDLWDLIFVGDDQDRTGGRIDDMLGNWTDNEIHEIISAVCAHNDQIYSKFLGNFYDGFIRLAFV